MARLIDIRAFFATARPGSFSAAARELNVAPSVITRRVSRLEARMGGPLFLRPTRALGLTAPGNASARGGEPRRRRPMLPTEPLPPAPRCG